MIIRCITQTSWSHPNDFNNEWNFGAVKSKDDNCNPNIQFIKTFTSQLVPDSVRLCVSCLNQSPDFNRIPDIFTKTRNQRI